MALMAGTTGGRNPASHGGGGSAPSGRERRVDVQFGTPSEFKTAMLAVEPGGLFVPGRYDLQVGDPVTVHCIFPGIPDGVPVRTRVLWRRLSAGRDANVRAGLGLVVRSSSMTTYRKLIEYAEGKATLPGRKEERFPTHIPVQCEIGEKDVVKATGEIADVSVQGAALRIPHRPAVGDRLKLRLTDPKGRDCALEGFVTWIRGTPGNPVAPSLVGVELQFPRRADLESWERIVARARADVRLSTEFRTD